MLNTLNPCLTLTNLNFQNILTTHPIQQISAPIDISCIWVHQYIASRQEPLPSHDFLYPPSHHLHHRTTSSVNSQGRYGSHVRTKINPHSLHYSSSYESLSSSYSNTKRESRYSSLPFTAHHTTTVDLTKKNTAGQRRSSREENIMKRNSHGSVDAVGRTIHEPSSRKYQSSDEEQTIEHSSYRRWGDFVRRDTNGAEVDDGVSDFAESADLETSNDGWLNLTDVGPQERGWYQCVSEHAFGDYSSNSVFINVLREYPTYLLNIIHLFSSRILKIYVT